MTPYKNLSGTSGVAAYEYSAEQIIILFKKSGTYTYTLDSVGAVHLETMKRLADAGRGLGGYINTNPTVKKGYV
jgi:hypothetical protein